MKKALLVIGLAMCTTAAFAQIHKLPNRDQKVNLDAKSIASVDYKASIFTKTEGDTIHIFDFEDISEAAMPGFVYGDNGTITAAHGNMQINGDTTLPAHNSQKVAATWRYIADSLSLEEDFADENIYDGGWYGNYLRRYFASGQNGNGDNGYMLMAMYPEEGSSKKIDASFTLPIVERPADVVMVEVSMYQLYFKFNRDLCYIDYRLDNGTWKSWEINIRGVDVEVNDNAPMRPRYTMPIELGQQDSICLRFRWLSESKAGGIYGYFWAVDDVAIREGSANRWRQYAENYVDGAYGMMPQGMKIPLAWFSNVTNNGNTDRTNIHTVVSALDADRSTATTIVDNNEGTLAAGNPNQQKQLTVDERNLFNMGGANNSTYWWAYGNVYNTLTVPQNYHSLPVDQLGTRYVTTSATSTGAITREWDTIPYQVVDRTGNNQTGTLYGYRWAHDNGLIANESRYDLQFTESQGENVWAYPSEDNGYHYQSIGYMVGLRYTTGSEIPTDEYGNPWALLGVEIIPSTNSEDYEGMDDVELQPIAWNIIWNETGDGARFYDVATGFSQRSNYHVSVDNDANFEYMDLQQGGDPVLNGAGQIGVDYNAVVLTFPGQPLLTPNLSYYLGYQMRTAGSFAAAQTRSGYYDEDNNYVYFSEDAQYADKAHQFNPYGMDVYLYDADQQEDSPYAAFSDNTFPMIRAIVGPRRNIPTYEIQAICDPEGEADSLQFTILNFDRDYVCDQPAEEHFEGSSTNYYIVPEGDHGYIDEIIIDGVHYNGLEIATSEENIIQAEGVFAEAVPYFVYDTIDGQRVDALQRAYFVVYFEDIQGGHDISAVAHWEPWHIGIDPVANECVLAVMPNPASSQVKVNISGVTGTVNCNIIDMSGRVVYNSDFNAEQGQVINLNNFARGAYFVRVTNGTFSKIEKLIVR